jgi:hypothetical protein
VRYTVLLLQLSNSRSLDTTGGGGGGGGGGGVNCIDRDRIDDAIARPEKRLRVATAAAN